jgi:GNAT superfamily N-acetyltransferase
MAYYPASGKKEVKMGQSQIERAAALIGRIDSGERSIFLDSVHTESQIEYKIFGEMAGVFFSGIAYKGLRISISFEADTEAFNEEIAALVRSSLQKANRTECAIWIRNENRKIIEFLKQEFQIPPDGGPHYYASIEFIMRRENFHRETETRGLEIRPYEKRRVFTYLHMLAHSMTFDDAPRYRRYGIQNAKGFAKYAKDNAFEAFWKDGALVGVYWSKNAEIHTVAVAAAHQRKGYGSAILTRAIAMAFEHTDAAYAYLYAVDWNAKGQSFYRKYGMEENAHSYLLHLKGNPP